MSDQREREGGLLVSEIAGTRCDDHRAIARAVVNRPRTEPRSNQYTGQSPASTQITSQVLLSQQFWKSPTHWLHGHWLHGLAGW